VSCIVPNDDNDDRKVKEMLESDLARWFGMPSAVDVVEGAQPKTQAAVDEEMRQVIERREKVAASVDPELVRAIHERTDENPRELFTFKPELEVQQYDLGILDESLVAKIAGDVRTYSLPEDLRDDMHDCTPQALLRDLHRPELEFSKEFQVIDIAAEVRVDVAEVVATAMTARYKAQLLVSPLLETRPVLAEIQQRRHDTSWLERLSTLPNRTVQE